MIKKSSLFSFWKLGQRVSMETQDQCYGDQALLRLAKKRFCGIDSARKLLVSKNFFSRWPREKVLLAMRAKMPLRLAMLLTPFEPSNCELAQAKTDSVLAASIAQRREQAEQFIVEYANGCGSSELRRKILGWRSAHRQLWPAGAQSSIMFRHTKTLARRSREYIEVLEQKISELNQSNPGQGSDELLCLEEVLAATKKLLTCLKPDQKSKIAADSAASATQARQAE